MVNEFRYGLTSDDESSGGIFNVITPETIDIIHDWWLIGDRKKADGGYYWYIKTLLSFDFEQTLGQEKVNHKMGATFAVTHQRPNSSQNSARIPTSVSQPTELERQFLG